MTQSSKRNTDDLNLIDFEIVPGSPIRCKSCGWETKHGNLWRCLNEDCPDRDVIEVELIRVKYERNATTKEIENLVKKMAERDGWKEFVPKGCDYTLWKDPDSQSQFDVVDLCTKYKVLAYYQESIKDSKQRSE